MPGQVHNGQKETVQATVEQRSLAVAGGAGGNQGGSPSAETSGPFGLALAPLDPQTRQELGLERQSTGALVA